MSSLVASEKQRKVARVGDKPIPVPSGVEITLMPENRVTVKGPGGELTQAFPREMLITIADGVIRVDRTSEQRRVKAFHGLTRALLNNMVTGVTEGYQKALELVGTGYRAQQTDEKLVLQVGYSHLVEFDPVEGVNVVVQSPVRILVSGPDKQRVGQVAAQIRAVRPPDHYKGKGIRYADEQISLKPGKAAARK